jgi:hypothetical protein
MKLELLREIFVYILDYQDYYLVQFDLATEYPSARRCRTANDLDGSGVEAGTTGTDQATGCGGGMDLPASRSASSSRP